MATLSETGRPGVPNSVVEDASKRLGEGGTLQWVLCARPEASHLPKQQRMCRWGGPRVTGELRAGPLCRPGLMGTLYRKSSLRQPPDSVARWELNPLKEVGAITVEDQAEQRAAARPDAEASVFLRVKQAADRQDYCPVGTIQGNQEQMVRGFGSQLSKVMTPCPVCKLEPVFRSKHLHY